MCDTYGDRFTGGYRHHGSCAGDAARRGAIVGNTARCAMQLTISSYSGGLRVFSSIASVAMFFGSVSDGAPPPQTICKCLVNRRGHM